MNEIIHYGLVLFIITVVAAAGLSAAYDATKPLIEEQEAKVIQDSLKLVVPEADDFKEIYENHYTALKDGELIGHVAIGEYPGYSSQIKIMVGYTDDKIIGMRVLSQQDTPGLGARVQEDEFQQQFSGVDWDGLDKVDAITGATISSKAVINGVKDLTGHDSVTGATEYGE